LRFTALIAPDDGAAHHFIFGVEQDRAMHLAGKSDTSNIFGAQI